MNTEFRRIEQSDNTELAALIRSVLKEHGVDKPGTVYTDPITDALFELFQTPGSIYWIATVEGEIVGGCGIFLTSELPIYGVQFYPESVLTPYGKQIIENFLFDC